MKKVLSLREIYKKYNDSDKPVIKGISLDFFEGNLNFICGPSGVGKSTLLHISGLMDIPDKGEIIFLDNTVDLKNKDELSKYRVENIGFMFQYHYLLENLKVEENIFLPYWIKIGRVEKSNIDIEVLGYLGILNLLNRYPYELSGGEQQRVALARALVNRPKLLIADEPTGNLDHANAINIIKLIREFVDLYKMTAVVATHNLELINFGDITVRLEDGVVSSITNNRNLAK